jgi:hypothetical protein
MAMRCLFYSAGSQGAECRGSREKNMADIDNYSAAKLSYSRINMKARMILHMRASFFNLQ